MAEDGGVGVVPEESMGGVGAGWMDAVETWSRDVGETKVSGVGNDGFEEVKDVDAANAHALQELFNKEEIVERLVGCERSLTGECGVGLRGRENSDVKEIGNEKVSCSGSPKQELADGDSESDLKA